MLLPREKMAGENLQGGYVEVALEQWTEQTMCDSRRRMAEGSFAG